MTTQQTTFGGLVRPDLTWNERDEPETFHKRTFRGLMPDWRIRELAEQQKMIYPFYGEKVRELRSEDCLPVLTQFGDRIPAISLGLSSYGYDLTLSPRDFRIFRHVPGLIVNPKAFDDRCLAQAELHHDEYGDFIILPTHTYGLGVTRERQKLPPNVTAQYIGKSTYARCGIIVNTTPGEAGWEGHLTLEISNSSGADCRIYVNEGICQALFWESEPCLRPYGDGKYQGQAAGVTLARI
jgi:dCTP deaminase